MRRIALCVAVVVLAACGTGAAVPSRASTTPGPKLLFFATALGVTVVDAESGLATATVPNGIIAADRSAVFGTVFDGGQTTVRTYDPGSGTTRDLATLNGPLRLRVANHDGSVLVLAPIAPPSTSRYPSGRQSTTLTILPTDGGAPRTVTVAANIEPEAVSADDTNVFVLQYLPADAPAGYQVRRLDVSTGELHNVRTDDSDLDKPMAGRARTQVLSPDGTRLYTLYVVSGAAPTDPGYAFVHVLDLVNKEAFCVDLPLPFGSDGSSSYAVTIAPDGGTVYAVDGAHGSIATLDTHTLAISSATPVTSWPSAATSAAVGPDGSLFIAAGPDLRRLDQTTFSTQSSYRLDAAIAAVVTTPFDRNVYVAVNETIRVFTSDDIGAGPISAIHVPGAPGLVAADPVPPVDARGPTECAC